MSDYALDIEDRDDEDRVQARKERRVECLWPKAQERTGAGNAGGVLRAAGLPVVPPAASLIAGRREFLTDAAGQPLTPVRVTPVQDPRDCALQMLSQARAQRSRTESWGRHEIAAVTFTEAAHRCAAVCAGLLLADAETVALSFVAQARAWAAAAELLQIQASRAVAQQTRRDVAA